MANKLRNTEYPLTELHRSGYEVADGYPDIRGWNILNGLGQKIGEVVELIFDPLSNSVRYLVVHIEGKPINLISRDVLVPIGLAQLVEETGIISMPTITLGHLALLPTYKRSEFNRAFERSVRGVFSGEKEIITEEADEIVNPGFYEHDHFNQQRFYDHRITNRIREVHNPGKAIERERITPIEKPVPGNPDPDNYLREDSHESFRPFREGSIELSDQGEVPHVKKETRTVEEVRMKKDLNERNDISRDKLRITDEEVERFSREDSRD
jgi:hypothetical protein